MNQSGLTVEAKASMRANLELELNTRRDKLRAMCEAQVSSLRDRLQRRVNRVPSNKRQMLLVDLLDAAAPVKAAPVKKEPAPAPNVRKTRAAPAANTHKPVAVKEVSKPATTRAAPSRATTTKETKATRGKKRGSDEMSSEDKENAADLAVPKRTKTVTQKATAASKPAAPTRATRAASRKVPASAQVLSPKTNNSRPTAATRTRRQR